MLSARLGLCSLLPIVILASPLDKRWDDFQVKHSWVEVPRDWVVYSEDAPPDHVLNLRIGLKQNKFDQLVDELYQVSDPRHERCGSSFVTFGSSVTKFVSPPQLRRPFVKEGRS